MGPNMRHLTETYTVENLRTFVLPVYYRLICVHVFVYEVLSVFCVHVGFSVRRRREVLTPSLFCPVLASISCRARTDRDCSNTKLQIHRSGGTYCRVEGEKDKEVRRERGQQRVEDEGREGKKQLTIK